jgi:hypothetical protein
MCRELEDIKKTLVRISKGETLLDTLLEFERTLDDAEVFAYRNWILGELVEGPEIGRYWYKVTLMFPYELMPDPDGGLRLTKLGAKISFRKGVCRKPVKVEGPQDWQDATSKKAKMIEHSVWLVNIDLPIKYINRGLENIDDIIMKDLEDANSEIVDAYDDELDTEAPPEDMMGGEEQGMGQPGEEEQMGGM